jgi:hypothetical protein
MMTGAGFVDVGKTFGMSVYGPPTQDGLTNQYAAMPSLHVGWALLVAVAMIASARGPWRWLWALHPLVTVLVVVGTANHYWADAIVVFFLLVAALAVALRWPVGAPGVDIGVPTPQPPASKQPRPATSAG